MIVRGAKESHRVEDTFGFDEPTEGTRLWHCFRLGYSFTSPHQRDALAEAAIVII